MDAAPAVTLIAVTLTVVVLAGYLIAIARRLTRVSSGLDVILGAVGVVVEKTGPVGEVIDGIGTDLAEGRAALDAAVERLTGGAPADPEGAGLSAPSATSMRWQAGSAAPAPSPEPNRR